MKKIAIIFFILIVAFFSFGYFQLEQAKLKLLSSLEENNITFSKVNIHILPFPSVIISSPQFTYKESDVSFDSAKFNLSIPLLLSKELGFNEIIFSNGKYQLYNLNDLDIKLSKTRLSLNDLNVILDEVKNEQFFDRSLMEEDFDLDVSFNHGEEQKVTFSTHINLNPMIRFNNLSLVVFYNDLKKYTIKINQGHMVQENDSKYKLWSDDLKINDGHFSDVITYLTLPENDNVDYYLTMASLDDYININVFQYDHKQSFYLSFSSSIESSELLKSLKLPMILSGKANLKANAIIKSGEILKGNYQLLSENGTIYGIGLLSMVSQYLPINYDEDSLKTKNVNTYFDNFYLRGNYENEVFGFSDIRLNNEYFTVKGDGQATLFNSECDINLKLGLNNEKYSEYASVKLPVRFFGQCDNPQYKLNVDKSLLKQLKPLLLKRVFKH